MTIEKGVDWGRVVPKPIGLRVVDSDSALVAALADGSTRPVAPDAGDLRRTLGRTALDRATEVREVAIDLLRVTLDDGSQRTACAHVTAQLPLTRGGWWRGDVVMVMNAQFLGEWHVVTRGHPNDGRAESCAWDSTFGLRQRWEARRRLPTGTHVPHPQIETRSFRARRWDFDAPMAVSIDGVPVGRSRSLDVTVQPDAAVIYS